MELPASVSRPPTSLVPLPVSAPSSQALIVRFAASSTSLVTGAFPVLVTPLLAFPFLLPLAKALFSTRDVLEDTDPLEDGDKEGDERGLSLPLSKLPPRSWPSLTAGDVAVGDPSGNSSA